MKQIQLILKRIMDIGGSLFGLTILFPVLLITAGLIKFTSKGPIFFLQERIGKDGKIFRIYKFRTMIVNAEKMGRGLSVERGDSRITPLGRILRSTSIDELPQFINVLKGEMSLVGPRPPVVYHPYNRMEGYPAWAKERFTVKPGITGYAQVRVRNATTWDERIRLDLIYVKNWSLWFDLKILARTLLKLFKSDNIYLDEKGEKR